MKSGGLTLSTMALVMVFLTACSSGSPRLRSITVTPSTATIIQSVTPAPGDTLQYTATGLLSDGSKPDETNAVTWTSSNTAVATISTSGVATAVGPGTTTITAALSGITGTATLSVSKVVSIAVTPANPSIASGATQQFVATATITKPDGTPGTMDVSSDPGTTWASATTSVAMISTTGLATGSAQGTSVISATFKGATGSTTLTVGPPTVASLVLTPATPTIAVGNTVVFVAKEKWTDGSLRTPALPVTFTSGTPATATINATSGVALALAIGTSTITATETATLTATTTLTVSAANARYAYVANTGDAMHTSNIGQFSVDVANGKLNALSPAFVSATQPQQVIVHPSGLYAYCLCFGGTGTIAIVYNVNPTTGTLSVSTPLLSTAVGTGGSNRGVIDPTGEFMFVIDGSTNTVGSFSINLTDQMKGLGLVTAKNSLPTGTGPFDVLIDHTGKHLYVVNSVSNTVSEYSIAANGTLALLATTTSTGLNGPAYSTIDPANKYLYVTNNTDNTLSIFPIDATTGLLGTPTTTPTITGAISVANVAVDPSNKYVYVLDSRGGATSQLYAFNTGAGVLGSPITGSPFSVASSTTDGFSSTGIAIDPTGAIVAVDNNASADISVLKISGAAPATPGALTFSSSASVAPSAAPNFVVFYIAP